MVNKQNYFSEVSKKDKRTNKIYTFIGVADKLWFNIFNND